MGRTKTYARDDLVERAGELFRSHGYAGTSAAMMEEHLGLNRSSIYSEFGSKRGLFDAALESYRSRVVDTRFAPLETPGGGLSGIEALFEFYGSASDGPAFGRGCLLCNTAIEFGPDDPSETGAVSRYLGRIARAFEVALDDAVRNAEIRESVDTSEEAQFLAASVLGLFVMLRAAAPPSTIAAAATAAIRHVSTLRTSELDT